MKRGEMILALKKKWPFLGSPVKNARPDRRGAEYISWKLRTEIKATTFLLQIYYDREILKLQVKYIIIYLLR